MSYNSDYWNVEQSSRPKNWETVSKEKKWYLCTTKNTLSWDRSAGLYYEENGSSRDMISGITAHYLALGYDLIYRQRIRAGYLQKGTFGVMPYLGQWGRGWIVATNKTDSSSSVIWFYVIIKDPEEGSNNGKQS